MNVVRLRLVVGALALAVACVGGESALACVCQAAWRHPADERALNTLVVVGTVLDVETGGGCARRGEWARVRVDEAFEGAKAGQVISVELASGSDCEVVGVRAGVSLLVFTSRESPRLGYCVPHLLLGTGMSYEYCADGSTGEGVTVGSKCPNGDEPLVLGEAEVIAILRGA